MVKISHFGEFWQMLFAFFDRVYKNKKLFLINLKQFTCSATEPKHFKIRKSLFFMSLLSSFYPQQFYWHFFQSCDGHTGMLKMMIKREIMRGQVLETDIDLMELFLEKSKFAQTRWIQIERFEKDLDCFEKDFKRYFSYSFCEKEGFVYCKEKTGDQNYVLQKITPKSPIPDWIPLHHKQLNRTIPMDICY